MNPTIQPQEQLHPSEGTRLTRWGGFQGFRFGFMRMFAIGAGFSPGPIPSLSFTLLGFHFAISVTRGQHASTTITVGFPFFSWGFMWVGSWWNPAGAVAPASSSSRIVREAARRAAAQQMLADDREHTLRCKVIYCNSAAHRANQPTPTGRPELDGEE